MTVKSKAKNKGNDRTPSMKKADFKSRLCHSLVSDVLEEMERELFEIKSMRFLADYPWTPGKRLRPIIFLLSTLSLQVEKSSRPSVGLREARLAAAIEILHEASLIHDDLVDQSLVRRGKPTMHLVNGAALALLIGDYMVFRGLKMVLDAAKTRQDILLAQELANTGLDIAHGEADQLDSYLNRRGHEDRMSMDNYLHIIAKKTAGFFAGCAEAGAALGGANSALREVYREYGMNLGLVFQMIDDLLDVMGDERKAQKTLRNSFAEGTITLPLIHAFELWPENSALQSLSKGKTIGAKQQGPVYKLLTSEKVIEQCQATLKSYTSKSLAQLEKMPVNIYRLGLADLLDFVRQGPWGGLESKLA